PSTTLFRSRRVAVPLIRLAAIRAGVPAIFWTGTPNGPNRQRSGTTDVPAVPGSVLPRGGWGTLDASEDCHEGRRGPRAAPDPRLGRAGAPPGRGPADRHPARPRGRGTDGARRGRCGHRVRASGRRDSPRPGE